MKWSFSNFCIIDNWHNLTSFKYILLLISKFELNIYMELHHITFTILGGYAHGPYKYKFITYTKRK
ncbi:hypothetical protein SPETJ133_01790 [Staphylococcus petrasii]